MVSFNFPYSALLVRRGYIARTIKSSHCEQRHKMNVTDFLTKVTAAILNCFVGLFREMIISAVVVYVLLELMTTLFVRSIPTNINSKIQ